jgi:hypothetical protein
MHEYSRYVERLKVRLVKSLLHLTALRFAQSGLVLPIHSLLDLFKVIQIICANPGASYEATAAILTAIACLALAVNLAAFLTWLWTEE